ncbi:MAG: NAD(P)H-binding protein [Lysobacterales bacterium]
MLDTKLKTRGLLIGAGGLLGPPMRNALNQAGFNYDIFARSPLPDVNTQPFRTGASRIIKGNLNVPEEVDSAVQNCRWIVYIPTNRPSKIAHTAQVVDAAQRHNVKVIVKVSAILAGADPPLSFGIEHRAAEKLLIHSTVPWIILRPAFFMQTFQMFAEGMQRHGRLMVPVPSGQTAFVDTQDVAKCVAACLSRPDAYLGKTLPLTGPEALSMAGVARRLSQASGRTIQAIAPPRLVARVMMRFVERMDPWLVTRLMQMFSALESNQEACVSPHVESILDHQATSFGEFLQRDPVASSLWQADSYPRCWL